MQVVTATPPPSPFPVRPLVRLAVAAIGAAVLVAAGGWLLQRALLGASESAARARVESEVRETFAEMAQQLRASTAVLVDPELVGRASAEDEAAAARLFAAAGDAIAASRPAADAALTVFATDGTPIAWAGRPSELAPSRLDGGEGYFFSATPLGPRLIYIRPVGTGEDRAGTVAAESAIGPAQRLTSGGSLRLRAAREETAVLPTRLAPVTIRPPSAASPATQDAGTFQVRSPTGGPLVTATVS